MVASVELPTLAKTEKDEAIRLLSKHYFFESFSAMLSMAAIAPFAVGVDLIMLGVFLVAMRERWTLMIKSLDSYIKNAPSIYSMHLSLAYSLPLLRITNVAERRGELRGEKMTMLGGEKWSEKMSMLGGERWTEIAERENRLSESRYGART